MAPNPPINQPANQPPIALPNNQREIDNQFEIDYWDEVDNLPLDAVNPVHAVINAEQYIINPVRLFADMQMFNINRRQAAILQAIQRQADQN